MSKNTLRVDEFIKYGTNPANDSEAERYARWVLFHMSMSNTLKVVFTDIMKEYTLYCDYKGKRYKVSGVNFLGTLWLSRVVEEGKRYDFSACVCECTNWGKE